MARKILILTNSEDYTIFADARDHSRLFAITKEEEYRIKLLLEDYDFKLENIPYEYTVLAYKLGKVGQHDEDTDEYDILKLSEVKFKINRIHFPAISMVPPVD